MDNALQLMIQRETLVSNSSSETIDRHSEDLSCLVKESLETQLTKMIRQLRIHKKLRKSKLYFGGYRNDRLIIVMRN
ncbi:unnamed protein product, partial [Ilex paraguariensis]